MSNTIRVAGPEFARTVARHATEYGNADAVRYVVMVHPDGSVDVCWPGEDGENDAAICDRDGPTAINLRGILRAARKGEVR